MNGKRRDLDSRDHDPEQYEDEYRAMEASLTEYVDERVKLLSGEGPAPPAGGRGEGWFRRWRADVYFVITLVLLGLLWWQQGLPTRGQDPAAGDEAAAAAPGSETTAAAEAEGPAPGTSGAVTSEAAGPPAADSAEPPIDLANPGDSWREFVEGHRQQVASWLRAVAEARGLAPDQVSSLQKGNFGDWAGNVEAGQPLGSAHLGYFRIGLFEFIYGRWSQGRETSPAKWGKVDLVVGATEYAPQLLSELLAQLGLGRWFEQPDPKDPALQAAVVVAWLRTHQP